MTRATKTPAQRATEAVDVLTRRLQRLRARRAALASETNAVSDEIAANEKRLEYAKAHPDLSTS